MSISHASKRFAAATAVAWLAAACAGDPGPPGDRGAQGPVGPAGPQGPAGENGTDGQNGQNGQDGQNGQNGQNGQDGQNGENGLSTGSLTGLVRDVDSAPVSGAVVSTVPPTTAFTTNGDGGFSFNAIPIGVYSLVIEAPGFELSTIEGVSVTAGQSIEVIAVLAKAGGSVLGLITQRAATAIPIAGATVALVPASAVADSADNDPLETLASTSTLLATTDSTGAYAIVGVPAGRYFIHVSPAVADEQDLLPGGDSSRVSFTVAAGASVEKNVTLSQRPSDGATFIGSGSCLICHGSTAASGWKETLHALVYRLPGQASANQDVSNLPNRDRAHIFFKDSTVEPLNTRDNTGSGDEYGLRISQSSFSAFPTAYNVLLGFDGRYFMVFETSGGLRSMKYYADFTFGGHGIYKERWVTRVSTDRSYDPTAGGDSSYYILPVQYDENMPAGIEPFHPYNAANWGPPTVDGGPTATPAQSKSFDNNCAGCHFTGVTLTRDTFGNFKADAANTMGGPFDYDGDSMADDVAIGCEACHGPGSEHIAAPGPGSNIVAPKYLSAERSAMICGQCHTRGEGRGTIGGVHTEFPSTGVDVLSFPRAGISFAEFDTIYHEERPGVYGDDTNHSRQHHQQYVDLVKSKHFRNEYDLLDCASCHNSHNRDIGPSLSARNDNNELCLGCHAPYGFALGMSWTPEEEAEAVSRHMTEYADMTSGYDPANVSGFGANIGAPGVGRCSGCHMPQTAASQSRFPAEGVSATGQPSGARIRGDVGSHVFDIIWPATSQSLYITATSNRQMPNSCGSCHNSLTGIQPRYVY